MNGLTREWWRLGGAFGIAFVILFIVGIVVQEAATGTPPSFDDPISEIRSYWEAEGQGYLAADYIFALAFLLVFLPFLAALRGLLGAAEGGGQLFSRTALLGGLLAVAITGGAATSWSALALGAENLDDSALSALMYVDAAAWNLVPLAFGVLVLASSIVIFSTGVVWRWLAILGAIVGVIAVISPLWILDGDPEGLLGALGFISFIGLAVWLLLTSIAMVLRREAPVVAVRDV
jgi:hypothetical protein